MKNMSSPRIPTNFRVWISNLWITNCEERFIVGEQALDPKTYFNKYKWWLKNEYRCREKNKNRKEFLS